MFLHREKDLFLDVLANTSATLNIDTGIIEKDYYITMILKQIAENIPEAVFKGGTSLSKCHHVIKRFSEDLDIGFNVKLSEGKRKQIRDIVVAMANDIGLSLSNSDEIRSRRDYNKYILQYDACIDSEPNAGLPSTVILETFNGSLAFPSVTKDVDCFMSQYLSAKKETAIINDYGLRSFNMHMQDLRRTLADKVFAICDYYLEGNAARNSRHIYDIYKLLDHITLDNEFKNLVTEVRKVRQAMTKCPSANESANIHDVLSQIISIEFYKEDYENLTELLLYENVDYETAIRVLDVVISSGAFEK